MTEFWLATIAAALLWLCFIVRDGLQEIVTQLRVCIGIDRIKQQIKEENRKDRT